VIETPPPQLALVDGVHLRWLTPDDAATVAAAVGESLDHLRPWLPWATEESADVAFQRDRLSKLATLVARGEEWQYGLFGPDDERLLGSFGLMTRRGPGTLEIGYWLHVKAGGRGYATQAAGALTAVARDLPQIRRVYIYCDAANLRSAGVARRLGYHLARSERVRPEAPGESGELQLWSLAVGMEWQK
jgi:RimJ/RimL family protein N-acetyltransferase